MPSRREILKILGICGVFLATKPRAVMAELFPKAKMKKEPRTTKNLFTDNGKALVGAAGGSSPIAMIKEAVSLIGGFERLDLKGKTVLVKPNVVSGEPNPATTNPDVVAAVVKILYEEGAKKVYVGDMSAMLTLSTSRNMKRNGIKKAAEDAGAEVIIFEDYDWVEVDISKAQYVKKAYVTEWIYNVDLIVNLPVIKTHRSATYSICLKNFIGCTHLRQRPYLIDSSHWEELVAEFNLAYRPDINIVDGTVSMIEGGPWEGTPANTNLIIASGDRVAADAAGLGIIKSFGKWGMVTDKDIWDQKQIKRAIEIGAGSKKEDIKLITGSGGKVFQDLMEKVRGYTGL